MKVSLLPNMICFLYVTVFSKATTFGCVEGNDFELFKMDMMKRMKLLSEKVEEMETVNAEQTLRLQEQDLKIAELEKELKQVTKRKVRDLKMAEPEKEPKRPSNNIASMIIDNKSRSNASKRPKQETKIPTTNADLNSDGRKSSVRRQYDGQPSFFAELSSNLTTLSPDHDIHFGHVITNNGGSYKNYTGIYTVPESGVFVFMWSITGFNSKTSTNIPMQLMVSGEIRGRFDLLTLRNSTKTTVSGFAILNVDAGDVVLLRTHPTFKPTGQIISNEWHRSTFGGWKIY